GRILMVTPVFAEEFRQASDLDVDIFLYSEEHLAAWKASPVKPRVHVKIDTGLSRQGFLARRAADVAAALKGTDPNLIVGLCTHFANVEDVTEHAYADE